MVVVEVSLSSLPGGAWCWSCWFLSSLSKVHLGLFLYIFFHALNLALFIWSATPHYVWTSYIKSILHMLYTSHLFSLLPTSCFCPAPRFTFSCLLLSCSEPWTDILCPLLLSPHACTPLLCTLGCHGQALHCRARPVFSYTTTLIQCHKYFILHRVTTCYSWLYKYCGYIPWL